MRRRGSYQAICHPRGITPPWLTSLRSFKRFIMGVAPPDPFPRRVRGAPPRRAPRGANACARVAAREKFAEWVPVLVGLRRASGIAFRFDGWFVVGFRGGRDCGFATWEWFFLNRSFSGRDIAGHYGTVAGIRVFRSTEFLPRNEFAL